MRIPPDYRNANPGWWLSRSAYYTALGSQADLALRDYLPDIFGSRSVFSVQV